MKSSWPITIFATVILAFIVSSSTFAAERKVNLRGTWKFSLGDNMNFAKPNYDDSKWEDMYVPAPWQEEGFREYRGFAWYRFKFEITFKADEPLFIELGRIDDVDEVYINGISSDRAADSLPVITLLIMSKDLISFQRNTSTREKET